MKPFASFAPRMRVMRYASERQLQTPNLAAHYKKELRMLLQVQRHSLSARRKILFRHMHDVVCRSVPSVWTLPSPSNKGRNPTPKLFTPTQPLHYL